MFDNIKDDYNTHSRDIFNIGFHAMVVYRFGRYRYKVKPVFIRKFLSLIYKVLYFNIRSKGIELPCEVEVGKGIKLEHNGGIIVSGYAKIGENCILRQGVTIGTKDTREIRVPTIGDNVDIGAGAKLLGGITIGDNVAIGANAVVISDIPDNSIAVGIPAKYIIRSSEKDE